MTTELTTGDPSICECPVCGKYIRDLYDFGKLDEGDEINCPHCDAVVTVESVETTVTLKGKK